MSVPALVHRPPRRTRRRRLLAVVGAAALVVSVVVAWGAASRVAATVASGGTAEEAVRSVVSAEPDASDGVVGTRGVSVYDDVPAVSRLDSDLLVAVRHAAHDAAADGVSFTVNSGWRSPRLQQQLLDEAVVEYGSREEAARWVATPETSAHVTGAAIDIGGWDATAWLSEHGASYGLCQTYANERWHFELRPSAVADGCPEPFVDPTHDPRLQ
jgi:hypothetical protein